MKSVGAAGRQAAEHVDGRVRRDGADAPRLAQKRDEERPAARIPEGADHRLRAQAVGVGLHHGRGLGTGRACGERPPVRDDGAQIDLQPPRMLSDAPVRRAGPPVIHSKFAGSRLM